MRKSLDHGVKKKQKTGAKKRKLETELGSKGKCYKEKFRRPTGKGE